MRIIAMPLEFVNHGRATFDNQTRAIHNRTVDLFGARKLPFLARRSYVYELEHLLLWSTLAGLLEGQYAAVVVAKSFHGEETAIALASATPTASNLFSLIWGMLCSGRPKIRLAMVFASGATLCVATVGFIPASPRAAYWFIAQVAAAQVFLAGVVTVRSAIWKSNYPALIRGRVTARLQGVRFVVGVLTSLTAARLADLDSFSHGYVYLVAAVLGGSSLWFFSRISIRGERRELRRLPKPKSLLEPLSPRRVFGRVFGIIRGDRQYRNYCIAQMLGGMAHLMTLPIVVAIITRDLAPGGSSGFWMSIVLLDALPKLVMLGSLGRWGRLFDQLGVLGMREVNLLCWTASVIFALLGDLAGGSAGRIGPVWFLLAVTCFALRGFAAGLGQGGGAVAWYIGHLHFARPEDAEVYMGIHVSLTGLRGLVAPLAGMLLWQTLGWLVWGVAIGSSLASYLLFSAMAREEERSNQLR